MKIVSKKGRVEPMPINETLEELQAVMDEDVQQSLPFDDNTYHEDWVMSLEKLGLRPYIDGAPGAVGEYVYSAKLGVVFVMGHYKWGALTMEAIQSAGDGLPSLLHDTMQHTC